MKKQMSIQDIWNLFENSFPEFKKLDSRKAENQFIDVVLLYGGSLNSAYEFIDLKHGVYSFSVNSMECCFSFSLN
jgi:hypothetical protein